MHILNFEAFVSSDGACQAAMFWSVLDLRVSITRSGSFPSLSDLGSISSGVKLVINKSLSHVISSSHARPLVLQPSSLSLES